MLKRVSLFCSVVLLAGVLSSGLLAMPDAPRMPVFVYLQATITDHVNLDITEDRLRRLLPVLEKYRKEHPQAHVSATLLFSGAASDVLARRNSETHIVDFVKGYIRRGVVEAGYDGSDEPTYETRTAVDFSNAQTPDSRWGVREKAADEILTIARDPLTGAPVPGKSGGLKRMQEVFGEAVYIAGVAPMVNVGPRPGAPITQAQPIRAVPPTSGGTPAKLIVPTVFPEIGTDTEIVHEIRRFNTRAMMAGLPEDNPANLPGFGGAEAGFADIVSPAPETSPEVYWQDNVLRLSEISNTSEEAEEAAHGFEGLTADGLKKDLSELNRSRVQAVRVKLADERYYLQHSLTKDDDYVLKYAYSHPTNPKLPADSFVSKQDVDAAYAKEQAALTWLADEFIPANPGSRFVSNTDLRGLAGPSADYSIPLESLRKAVSEALDKWAINTFPLQYLRVDDRYLSLADWFQVMTDALAEFDRTGKLPESVRVVQVYGPDHTPMGHGPNVGEVTAASVAHVCSGLVERLHDTSGDPPKNSIPTSITVDGINMNAAQFLRLMASALVAQSPDSKLRVRMTYLFPGQAQLVPKTRPLTEMGASWTVKPAPLALEVSKTTQ